MKYFGTDQMYFAKRKSTFVFPITSNVRLFSGSNVTFNEFIFINAIKPDNSYKNSTILVANSKGYLCNVNSIAMCQFGLPKIANCEYRYNIRAIHEDILVSNDFRDKKQSIHFNKYNAETAVSGFVEVKPLSLTIPPDSNSTTLHFNEKSTLAGYITIINFSYASRDPMMALGGVNLDARFVIPENARNESVWKFFNKRFGTNYLSNEKIRSVNYDEPNADMENQEYLIGDASDLNFDAGTRILTKRLWNGKLIDLAEKRYEIGNNENRVKTEEEFDPKDTVFKDSLDPDKSLNKHAKVIFRKNLLEKITDKEKNNFKIKLFYILSAIWLALAVTFNSLVLSESYGFNYKLLEQLNAGRNASYLLSLTGSVMTNIYEIELILSNKQMVNKTEAEKDKLIRSNFDSIDKVIVQVIEGSNSLSQYLSNEAMENIVDFTYNLDIPSRTAGIIKDQDFQEVSGLMSEFEMMNLQDSADIQKRFGDLLNNDDTLVEESPSLNSNNVQANDVVKSGGPILDTDSQMNSDIFNKMINVRKLASSGSSGQVTINFNGTQADVNKYTGAPNLNFDVSVD
jgi:hypothetical protein